MSHEAAQEAPFTISTHRSPLLTPEVGVDIQRVRPPMMSQLTHRMANDRSRQTAIRSASSLVEFRLPTGGPTPAAPGAPRSRNLDQSSGRPEIAAKQRYVQPRSLASKIIALWPIKTVLCRKN